MGLQLRRDLRVEEIDGEALVLDRGGETVQRVRGDAVEALRLVIAGVDEDAVPGHLVDAMAELDDAGILAGDNRWSRRKLLVRGGVGIAAASVATFALASPAWAVSDCPSPPSGTKLDRNTTTPITASGNYYFTPMTTMVDVQVWGGGGSGAGGRRQTGGGAFNRGGGGGGGGGYARHTTVTVTPCMSYAVVVGAAVAGGSGASDGTMGNTSSFPGDSGTVSATGGSAGRYNNTGVNAGGVGSGSSPAGNNRTGGSGAGVQTNTGGGGGEAAGSTGNGTSASGQTGGAGGNADGGNGGDGGQTNGDGDDGTAPGGGGGGADVPNSGGGFDLSGGLGARGQVTITVA